MPSLSRICHHCETKLIGTSKGFCCDSCSQWCCDNCVTCTESKAVYDTEEIQECKKLCKDCGVKGYKESDNLHASSLETRGEEGDARVYQGSSYLELSRVSGTDDLSDVAATPSRDTLGHSVQHTREEIPKMYQECMLAFGKSSRIWYPQPPKDDKQGSAIEHSSSEVSLTTSHRPATEEPLDPLYDQLRPLVAQLLHEYKTKWLDIVTSLALRAANFIKPDTDLGSSMDPRAYVKIKCLASGEPLHSDLIRGIVCSKTIDYNRTCSEYSNPRLMILAGSLEHQRVAGQLASFDTLLPQETDHLTTIMAQIETLSPNVLLVEKSVTSYARKYLLTKDIPLVLDMKRPLLEHIARCTGALICLLGDSISTAQVGHCKLLRIENVMEQPEAGSEQRRKAAKTLMYFEGCPRHLGCTVLLKGARHEELKTIKHVVKYAVFAAYHLVLETSFLKDECPSQPIMPSSSDVIFSGVYTEHWGSLNEDSHKSILFLFSSRCRSEKKLCEHSHPLRIEFYGTSDKPLRTYLYNDLFTQTSQCKSCEMSVDAHTHCYTHQNGNLAINANLLSSMILPGEQDGKIWMWHRCLRCARVDGVPPASRKVVLSDAASRLSFGSFVQLNLSNHATSNRVASCGHSLQRDCLNYFGLGEMVVSCRYSPIDIHTIYLPPSELEFNSLFQQEWICKDAVELIRKVQTLYEEISVTLSSFEARSKYFDHVENLRSHVRDFKDQIGEERDKYCDELQRFCGENLQNSHRCVDILELNRMKCTLLTSSHAWDNRLFLLNSRPKSEAALDLLPLEVPKLNVIAGSKPRCISSASGIADEAWMLIPEPDLVDIVTPVYKDDLGSAVSYALSSKKYKDWIASRPNTDFHLNDEEVSAGGCKVKFFVRCYYATQFDSLRKKYCPSEVEFLRSLSRCKEWNAQGGKSNVYFAKSLDERFIIKEIVKTELKSFEKFSLEYFKYLEESFSSRIPTCFAKILGIYQVSVKKTELVKKDFIVVENLFYNRRVSKIYDLKGSMRARYNPDTSGENKVLLDTNLLEAEPIFVGIEAKRMLERAIWNDTSFLSSVDVMDYSLLVGFDEERKELVVGIVDFLRQYTFDKKVETALKRSGLLGGPTDVDPTIIPPQDYKKRFRKAMTRYFVAIH